MSRPAARALVALPLVALTLAGCGGGFGNQPRSGVRVESLLGDKSGVIDMDKAIVGSRISLRGKVVRVLTPHAFTIGPADNGTNHETLVLDLVDSPQPGQSVQIDGLVDVFLDDATARKYGLSSTSQYPEFDHQRDIVAGGIDETLPSKPAT